MFILETLKEKWVLADLLEHEPSTKILDTSRFPVDALTNAKQSSERKHVPFGILSIRDHLIVLYLFVQLRLERTHPNLSYLLDLIRQLGLDILLETTLLACYQNGCPLTCKTRTIEKRNMHMVH